MRPCAHVYMHTQGGRPLPGTAVWSTAGPREEREAFAGWGGALSAQGPCKGVKQVRRENTHGHMVMIQHSEGVLPEAEAVGP